MVHANSTLYSLSSVPAFAQEGNTVTLILTVSGFSSTVGTTYQFRFLVRDPANVTYQSNLQNYTTVAGQYQFTVRVTYPSATFPGSNSLIGQYIATVDQLQPVASPGVATSSFFLSLTDGSEYQRTQTVNIQGSGYRALESVNVVIRNVRTSTVVFSQSIQASPTGLVITNWVIPVNASIGTYALTMTGVITVKSPSDSQLFSVNPATMTIGAITTVKSTYQRTETMKFSFQPTYPDGTTASTGVGLLNLMDANRRNVTLTAYYDSVSKNFNTTYTTSSINQTGTWTATLFPHSYSDAYQNTGPGMKVSINPQLTPATLAVSVSTDTNFVLGQQSKFNASITYPDGTALTSGMVSAYLLYSGTPAINDSIPLVYDTGLGLWVGTYTPKPSDTGGLWSLVVEASDSPTPPNTGSARRAITLQNNTTSSPGSSPPFPSYYFGIIAALMAGLLVATFLAIRRRKVTHARLKIDLEAVRSEAGQIESQDFFKSIKEQVTKDEEH